MITTTPLYNENEHIRARLDLVVAGHLSLLPELPLPLVGEGLGQEVGGVLGALGHLAPRDVEGLGQEAGGANWCWPAMGGAWRPWSYCPPGCVGSRTGGGRSRRWRGAWRP